MFKRFRFLGSIPVFPAALAVGALLLGLPWLKILLLGLLAVGLTLLCALFLAPKNEAEIPANWNRDLRKFRRILDKIQNRTVTRRGQEILAELKQCRSALPFLTKSARREITDYYLPTFLKFFNAYETFEESNGGNPSILATMEQMERSLEQIADGFRKTCDRNDRTTELNLRAETALLSKKLKEEDLPRDGFPS
ncbi:MAG: hypothetical protein J6M34_03780 [Clostridia bacterium]|nr:hypothetical protein [Clostridia bacterium]